MWLYTGRLAVGTFLTALWDEKSKHETIAGGMYVVLVHALHRDAGPYTLRPVKPGSPPILPACAQDRGATARKNSKSTLQGEMSNHRHNNNK
jgi:hypothetical protein